MVVLRDRVTPDRMGDVGGGKAELDLRPDPKVHCHRVAVGQPDDDGPPECRERDGRHHAQYPPSRGPLRNAPYQSQRQHDPGCGEGRGGLGPDGDRVADAGQQTPAQGEPPVSDDYDRPSRKGQDDQILDVGEPAVEEHQAAGGEGQAGQHRACPTADRAHRPGEGPGREGHAGNGGETGLNRADAPESEDERFQQAKWQVDQMKVPLVGCPVARAGRGCGR